MIKVAIAAKMAGYTIVASLYFIRNKIEADDIDAVKMLSIYKDMNCVLLQSFTFGLLGSDQ